MAELVKPNVGGFECKCYGQPTRTEQVIAERFGIDVVEVHAFMCTWERTVAKVLDGIDENTINPLSLVVYVVLSGGGLEGVWFTEDEAVNAVDKIHDRSPTSFIAVRSVGCSRDTPESTAARNKLNRNDRLKAIYAR